MLLTNKSNWVTKSSSVLYNVQVHASEKAIDGQLSDSDNFFHSDYEDLLPWLQVKLEKIYVVIDVEVYNRKGMYAYDSAYTRDLEYIEVRTIVQCPQISYFTRVFFPG